jgi:hypothetical protein
LYPIILTANPTYNTTLRIKIMIIGMNDFCEICGTLADDRTNELVAVQCDNCAEVDCDWEDDGQPSEYDEWQDYMGGDDWDHGQYDEF